MLAVYTALQNMGRANLLDILLGKEPIIRPPGTLDGMGGTRVPVLWVYYTKNNSTW
jgi:hypothetical protein